MSRILISGYYGFDNAGDEAILAGILQVLRELDPQLRFTVISGRAARTRPVHGVDAVSRDHYRDIWHAVGESDLVLSGGGSLLQDVTGFKSVPYYLGVAGLGLLRRRPVMFYAQGVGPLQRAVSRVMVARVANRVQAITVRDGESLDLLRHLGVRRPPVHEAADAALVLDPGDPAGGRRWLAGVGMPPGAAPLLGVALRPLAGVGADTATAFARAMGQALDTVARTAGVRIVFIPMQPVRDVPIAQAVLAHMTTPALVACPDTGTTLGYRWALDLIAACDLVAGMRYHSLLFAAMAGRRVVGLSYDPKNDNLLRSLNLPPPLPAAGLTAAALAQALTGALTAPAAIAVAATDRLRYLSAQARRSARIAMDLLGRRG